LGEVLLKAMRTGKSGEAPVVSGLRFSLIIGSLLLACSATAGEPAKRETPLEKAKRLVFSKDVKKRVIALESLRGLKGTGHIEKEKALRLYGIVALSLRKHWRSGTAEAKKASEELASRARFRFMRWRGEIGRWEVRLAQAVDRLTGGARERKNARVDLEKLDAEVSDVLAKQNDREYGIDIAFLLGRIREAAGKLPEALKAYRHSLALYANHRRRRKHYSAKVEDYWGLLDEGKIKAEVNRLVRALSAKREPQLSFEKARRLQASKKYKLAQTLFDKVAKEYTEHLLGSASNYYGAECSYALKQYVDCRQRLQSFITSSPHGSYRGHAHLLLGDILTLLAFDLDRGAKEYAAAIDPKGWKQWWPATIRAEAKSVKLDGTWKSVRHRAHDRLGVIAYFDRKYPEAEKHFRESARLRPPRERYPGGVPVGMELVGEKVRKRKLPYRVTQDVLRGDRRVGFALFWAAVLAEGWRYGEAMAVCDRLRVHLARAITQDQMAYLCVRRGELFCLLKKPADGEKCFRQFADPKGKYVQSRWGAEACLLYSSMLYARGKNKTGEKYLVMAYSRYPHCKWADWAMYQWALMKARDPKVPKKKALGYVESALSKYPESEFANVARLVMKDLKGEIRKKWEGPQK